MPALSLRRLWTLYKRAVLTEGLGASRRDEVLAQNAFYSGARGVLKVLAYMIEQGEDDEVRKTIQRQGQQIKALQGLHPRARRH